MENQTPQAPAQEPNFKVAFEFAARQRDSANQQLCNLQIDLAILSDEKDQLVKENADLKQKLADLENTAI